MPQRFADVSDFVLLKHLLENELCETEVEHAEDDQDAQHQHVFQIDVEDFEEHCQTLRVTSDAKQTEELQAGQVIEYACFFHTGVIAIADTTEIDPVVDLTAHRRKYRENIQGEVRILEQLDERGRCQRANEQFDEEPEVELRLAHTNALVTDQVTQAVSKAVFSEWNDGMN